MGRLKEMMIVADELGLEITEALGKFVCGACCSDDKCVEEKVAALCQDAECSYCGRSPAAPLDELLFWIMDAIGRDWSDEPMAFGAGYDSETKDYMLPGMVKDPESVLSAVGFDARNAEFGRDLCDTMSPEWCRRVGLGLSIGESLEHGWEVFCGQVGNLCHKDVAKMLRSWPNVDIPNQARHSDESTFGDVCAEVAARAKIRSFEQGDVIYRARAGIHTCESALLAPPPNRVRCAGRMSPAGVPVFYGGMDAKTAVIEIADKLGDTVSIGKFRVTEKIPVLDLSDLPEVPSFFGDDGHIREQVIFLWRFAEEIARPVDKNIPESEKSGEYAPTQIFAGFLAKTGAQDGVETKIDGVIYRSARNENGECCAIFPHASKGGDTGNLRLEKAVVCKKSADGNWRKQE